MASTWPCHRANWAACSRGTAPTAVALEPGVHTAALAIAVGSSVDTVLTIPAAVYSSFMFLSAGVFARVMHQRNGPAVMPS